MMSNDLWQTYAVAYHNSELWMYQSLLVSIVSGETLSNFPQKLPMHLQQQYAEALHAGGQAAQNAKLDPNGTHWVDFNLTGEEPPFSQAVIGIMLEGSLALARSPRKHEVTPAFFTSLFDCDRVIRAQQLVMIFGQIDSFLARTIHTICLAKPEVLKKESKSISWQRVMEAASLDELKDQLIDFLVFDMGWQGGLMNRLEVMRKKFGLTIDTSKVDTQGLDLLERIRDITVHNGGRVNQEFIDKTHLENLSIGETYPVTDKQVGQLFIFAKRFCGSLYLEVSTKFLGKKTSEITGVMHRL